jgi:GrpE protein
VSVSKRPTLIPALGLVALLAVLTGAAAYLASTSPLVGLIGLIGAAASGTAAVLLMPEPAGRTMAPAPAAPASASAPPHPRSGDSDRGVLVQTCIYVRDRVTSTALAARLDQALRQVGVSTVEPAGERFDPSHHEAGGALPTANEALVGTIAAVEAPGYADRGVLLRPPVVTVYQRRPS